MSPKPLHLALLAGAVAMAGLVAGFSRLASERRTATSAARAPVLALIPPNPSFVLTLDVAALRKSAAAELLGKRLGELSSLSSRCEFKPLEEIEELAVTVRGPAVPDPGSRDDFAIVATGPFSKSRLLRCAELSIRERKGEPALTQIGRFGTARDKTKSGGELAVKDGGPLILSGGNYFRELLDAAEPAAQQAVHTEPRDVIHAELRRQLGTTSPLLATWVLPHRWTKRFVSDRDAELSPLVEVRAIGLKAQFEGKPGLEALLGCTTEAACKRVADFMNELKGPLKSANPMLERLTRVEMALTKGQLQLRLNLEVTELVALLEWLFASGLKRP